MNIAKLNTASLDDKTFIIKRGTSGGGTPINNQSKVVDITENGTTEVVPDSGFTGLSKVEVNVNVSGGSGEGENGEFTMEYYDVNAIATAANTSISSIMQFMKSLLSAGIYLLVKANDTIIPLHIYSLEEIANLTPSAISILYGTRTILDEANDIVWTSVEMDKKTNGMYSMLFAPNKITKEQFYSLE